jgi:hypothetical protein
MRVRLETAAAASSLAAAIERAGGSAEVSGDTLELVHPSGGVDPHDLLELEFFVRAWLTGAERAERRRLPVEILG